jgi:hypothetical protein
MESLLIGHLSYKAIFLFLCPIGDLLKQIVCFVFFMVFNTTFNNISVISWQSVLLVGETGGPGDNHRPVTSH